MKNLPSSLERLISELSKLPSIGPKSAQRLALFLLKRDPFDRQQLAKAVEEVGQSVIYCEICHNMAESNPCSICTSPTRDKQLICVVEDPLDALAIERSGGFSGVFHVLGGVLNPLEGIGPEDLNFETLKERIISLNAREVIIATNPTLEGETTAIHITKLLKDVPISVTRIARGLPMGGDLEYADEMTLSRALEGRREI